MRRRALRCAVTPLLAAGALLVACSANEPGAPGEAQAPSVGKADSSDRADHDCVVVLRSAGSVTEYLMGPSGPPSTYLEAKVDVADGHGVRGVAVLYRTSNTSGRWYTATPDDTTPGAGVTKYRFALRHFVEGGSSLAIDLIPYVWLADGARLFDHNRVADDASYELVAANEWTVADDPEICGGASGGPTAHYILSFPDFETTLEDGPVARGGSLKVTYDGRRLRETQDCLGAEGPVSATSISLFYAFDDGEPVETQVEQYTINYGSGCPESPCVTQQITEPVIQVPARATSIALWFACIPGFSYGAQENWKYDSNYGANYVLPVE